MRHAWLACIASVVLAARVARADPAHATGVDLDDIVAAAADLLLPVERLSLPEPTHVAAKNAVRAAARLLADPDEPVSLLGRGWNVAAALASPEVPDAPASDADGSSEGVPHARGDRAEPMPAIVPAQVPTGVLLQLRTLGGRGALFRCLVHF
ncbi:MAG: hypothetical protein NZ898_13125 [Myxococcota bacterium]|nr:hypothetical protein [Myxococcota bacterium]MDW8363763.1 hypothetical protein [Myxococcales bacterium]